MVKFKTMKTLKQQYKLLFIISFFIWYIRRLLMFAPNK